MQINSLLSLHHERLQAAVIIITDLPMEIGMQVLEDEHSKMFIYAESRYLSGIMLFLSQKGLSRGFMSLPTLFYTFS
jgi:hypothetical protein